MKAALVILMAALALGARAEDFTSNGQLVEFTGSLARQGYEDEGKVRDIFYLSLEKPINLFRDGLGNGPALDQLELGLDYFWYYPILFCGERDWLFPLTHDLNELVGKTVTIKGKLNHRKESRLPFPIMLDLEKISVKCAPTP